VGGLPTDAAPFGACVGGRWGKSPFLALICAVEFLGPCRFGGWAEDGSPIVVPVPNPWISLVAVNMTQTAAVMELFDTLFSPQCIAEYGLDIGKEYVYRASGGKIERVTSSPRSIRGGRVTFYCLDETSEWVSGNAGHAMMERIRGNIAKSREGAARALEICNAFVPGEDSVAERTYEAWTKLKAIGHKKLDLYYDSIEAPADTRLDDEASLEIGLSVARGDSIWLDIPRFIAEIQDPDTAVSLARRDYLNQITAAEDALVRAHRWDACLDSTLELHEGDTIVLGFDGSKSDDSTALVACRVSDRAMFLIGLQEKNPLDKNWTVDPSVFDGLVGFAFEHYNVRAFYADVHPWETWVDVWSERYREELAIKASTKSAIGWDMRSNQRQQAAANERLIAAVNDQSMKHTGDVRMRAHVLNARRYLTNYGLMFRKESRESPRKVDIWAAMMLADMARSDLIGSGNNVQVERGMVRLR
jgi:hypothetical protein